MFQLPYRYILILFLSGYSCLNIFFTIGTAFFDFEIPPLLLFGLLTFVVLGIWEFNRLCDNYIISSAALEKIKIHPLISLFILSLLIVLLVTFACLQLLYAFLGMGFQVNLTHIKLLMAFGFRVNLFMHCVNAIVYYINRLKETQLQAEQLKKATIEAQFETLRAQINPHFLFNCFNVLSSLVYKDANTAARFIGQLSSVYRYLLFCQDKKVVLLSEELAFLNAYIYLLKIRFGDNLSIENTIPENNVQYVAPAVLQMLIENAIKHNVVSRKAPLKINLFLAEGYLNVSNTLQEKVIQEESSKVGLKNIRERYRFLTDQEVKIEKTDSHFRVRLPLLNVIES